MAAVDLAQQILPGDRHVLGIAGAEEIMALVGAGAAFDAGVEIDAQRSRTFDQFAQARDRLVVPVVDQLAWETERDSDAPPLPDRALTRPSRRRRAAATPAGRRASGLQSSGRRPLRSPQAARGGFEPGRRRVTAFARIVGLVAARAEEHAGRMQQFGERKDDHQRRDEGEVDEQSRIGRHRTPVEIIEAEKERLRWRRYQCARRYLSETLKADRDHNPSIT